jgi:hypothetical protein
MKTIPKTCCPVIVLVAACSVQAQTLTYSNSIVVPAGTAPTVMAVNIPQFNPSEGTLDGVNVTMYSSFDFLFTYDGSLASGELTFTQTSSLSFLYNGSDVLSQRNLGPFTFTAGLPSQGRSFTPPAAPTLQGQSFFSDVADLAIFTGTGQIPLSADYDNEPTVTWTGGTVTWNLDDSATAAAVVTYNFTPVPEPGSLSLLMLSSLAFFYPKHRQRSLA